MNIQELDKKHQGRRGFVIGGGPSLRFCRTEYLQHEITVGANKSYKLFEPTYLAICDWKFCVLYAKEMTKEASKCIKFTKLPYIKKMYIHVPNLYGIAVDWNKTGQGFLPRSFSDPMTFPNAGGSALIVAYLLGLNPIYLLGIDCISYQNRTHFHEEYNQKEQEERIRTGLYTRMRTVFLSLVSQLQKQGITIYSCSPISTLNDVLPFAEYHSLFLKKNR